MESRGFDLHKGQKNQRLVKSIFRLSLDFIRGALLSVTCSLESALKMIIQFIDLKSSFGSI